MGSVAPPHPWDPEDDLLLKSAIEAGASIESLSKGAVCFSRRFTCQELIERWHSLLYDRGISEIASSYMTEIDLFSSTDIKSNKLGEKEKGTSFHRQRNRSLRSLYYSKRKRIRNEPYQFDDFGSCPFVENTDCNGQMELSQDKFFFGNSLGSHMGLHYQMQEADFGIAHGALDDVLNDGPDVAIASESFQIGHIETDAHVSFQDHLNPLDGEVSCEVFEQGRTYAYGEDMDPMLIDGDIEQPYELRGESGDAEQILEENMNYHCSGVNELTPRQVMQLENCDDTKAEPVNTFSLNSDGPKSICPSLQGQLMKSEPLDPGDTVDLQHLEFSSPLPDLPMWGSGEETPTMPDFEKEGKITALTLQGEVSNNLNSPGCDDDPLNPSVEDKRRAAVELEGDFDAISAHVSFFIGTDGKGLMGKPCLGGLSNIMMNSSIVTHCVSAPNYKKNAIMDDISAVPDDTGTGEAEHKYIQLGSGHNSGNDNLSSPSNPVDESSKLTFLHEPIKEACPLNTEDPVIPCNDDVFPPEISSPSFFDMLSISTTTVLGSSLNTPGDEVNFSMLSITHKGQTPSHITPKFGPASQVMSMQHSNSVKPELTESGCMSRPSVVPSDGLNPDVKRKLGVPKDLIVVSDREHALRDTSHIGNSVEVPYQGSLSTNDAPSNSKLTVEGSGIISACGASCKELIFAELGSEDQLPDISSSDQEEKPSDIEDEVPSFSDVEALILDMDLFPYDEESSFYAREVSKYKNVNIRKKIVKLEQSTKSCLLRTIAFRGALAVFYGYRLKYYLKKPEVLIGRSTEEVGVDIDLRDEGRANKISRRQAIIVMDEKGCFFLNNLGRFPLVVNGKNLLKGQSCLLSSGSLIEIRGMWFIFEVNPDSVQQYLTKKTINENMDQRFQLYSFKSELS